MAITGIMLLGFVFVHMVGNLKMYLGAEDFNHYAEFLRELLVPILPRTVALWLMRLGLIGAVALHIHAAYGLTVMNRKARSVKYQSARDYQVATFASRTMRWTGIIVFLFLFWHLADLTWGFGQRASAATASSCAATPTATSCAASSVCRSPSSTSSPTSRSASTCSTACGASSSAWAGTTRASTSGAATSPSAFATIIVVGNVSFPIAVLAGIVGK